MPLRIAALLLVIAVGELPAAAQPIGQGATEFSIAGGFGANYESPLYPGTAQVREYHLVPHLGWFPLDGLGRSWWRGELELLVEPTLIVMRARETFAVGGVSTLGRWVFGDLGPVRPYLEVGGGVLAGQSRLPETRCGLNFILQGGVGALVFVGERTALTLGYRYHHVSNGSLCTPNFGVNANTGLIGVSYFFR